MYIFVAFKKISHIYECIFSERKIAPFEGKRGVNFKGSKILGRTVAPLPPPAAAGPDNSSYCSYVRKMFVGNMHPDTD